MKVEKTVAIVVKSDEGFLLVKRSKRPEKNYWAFPGGHVDRNESTYDAARREAREEVGDALKIEKEPIFVFTHDVGISHRHECHVFRGSLKERKKLRPGSDAADLGFFTLNRMKRMNLTHYTIYILNKFLE